MPGDVLARGDGPNRAPAAEVPVEAPEEVETFEPPVAEQFRIERRDDDAAGRAGPAAGDPGEQAGEMGRVAGGPVSRHWGLVGTLVPEVRPGSGDPPELEATRPADLVELQVPLVARVPLLAAPYLERGAGIPDQGGDRRHPTVGCDAVRPVRRAFHRLGRPGGVIV